MLTQILAAVDELKATKAAYMNGSATYEEMKDAATKVILLRMEAETKRFGKPRTKLTSLAIASLIR